MNLRLVACLLFGLAGTLACQSASTNVLGPSSSKCAVSVPSSLPALGAGGGTGSLTVTVAAECVWNAASESDWISITENATGQGTGVVRFSASGNPSSVTRRGALVIGSSRIELSQAGAACQFILAPQTESFGADGGDGVIELAAIDGCQWSARSESSWLSIVSGSSGVGSASIRYRADANPSGTRSGALTIADRTFVVNQSGTGAPCLLTLGRKEQSIPASGGTDIVPISGASECSWSIVSHAPWIVVTGAAAGSGSGVASLAIAANPGVARVGLVSIAGQTYIVNQAGMTPAPPGPTPPLPNPPTPNPPTPPAPPGPNPPNPPAGCSYALSATSFEAAASGGTSTVGVTATDACGWTVTTPVPWITITAGASGSGNGTVKLTIAVNQGTERSSTVTIAALSYSVSQAAATTPQQPCTYDVGPTSLTVPAAGGARSVDVSASRSSCEWTANSRVPWITVTSGAAGTGNQAVQLDIAANEGAAREGTIEIAGATVTVTQAAATVACTYSLTPSTQQVSLLGGEFTATVTTQAGCRWTAATNEDWIQITGAASGAGAGTVHYRIPLVSLGLLFSRTGTVTIGGETLTVQQRSLLVNER